MAPKNSLEIRLTESVVFLRGSVETTVTGRRAAREAPPAMLRGLLTLTLDKPTKISSIEITLEGKTSVSWPEGSGARKLDITEEHEIFSATQVYFRAGKPQAASDRRTASVGPGLTFDHEELEDDTISNEEAGYRSHLPRVSTSPQRRRVSMDYNYMQRNFFSDIPTPPYSPPDTRPGSLRAEGSSNSIPMTLPEVLQELPSVSSENGSLRMENQYQPHHASSHLSRESSEPQSSSSSIADVSLSRREFRDEDSQDPERSASRGRPRLPAVRTNGTPTASRTPSTSTAPTSPLVTLFHPPHYPSPRPPSHTSSHNSINNSNANSANNSSSILTSQNHFIDGEMRPDSASPHRERGRRHARFSLAMVSNVLLDAVKERVRSNSPRPSEGKEQRTTSVASRDHSQEDNRASRVRTGLSGRNIDMDDERGRRRSRDEDRAKNKEKEHERSTLGRITDALGFTAESGDRDGWKEFRKGTYTYPISFAIPGDSPPSLECGFGTVRYRLKATVHRPGTFTHRLSASREVTLIASPGEDDVDETDNIVVQREWDSQMHYLIIISGREFPIGSSIPIHITFMPIAKIKIFRISAFIEEKVEYYTQFKKVVRAEAVRKFELLSCRYYERDAPPILPMTSDDYATSPLRGYVDSADESEAASSLMGPGPWSIQAELQLPKSCSMMHFTNKHKRSNISISHNLKIVFRVERGDDEFIDSKTKKRKHFDIVVQTPLHILSCRCNPDWTSLPRYSRLEGTLSGTQACPCTQRKDVPDTPESAARPPVAPTPVASTSTPRHSSFHYIFHPFDPYDELSTPLSPTVSANTYTNGQLQLSLSSEVPSDLVSLYRRNTQFARLVAGEESEVGEPPPQYDVVASLENASGAQAFIAAIPADL